MLERRRKVSPASAFLPVVSCLSPAPVLRNQISVRYRWSRIIPALNSSDNQCNKVRTYSLDLYTVLHYVMAPVKWFNIIFYH